MRKPLRKNVVKERSKEKQLDDLEEKQLREIDNYCTYALRFGFVNNAVGSDINHVEQLLEKVEIARQTTRTCFYQLRNLFSSK